MDNNLIPQFVNFGILVGGLGYLLRQPLKDFVRTRHETIKEDLGSAQARLAAAQKEYSLYQDKLNTLSSEIQKLSADAAQEAENSKNKIISEAKKLAEQILVDAKKSSESMVGDFKTQMRSELAEQVIARTETLLKSKLTTDDKSRLNQDFSKQLSQGGSR